MTLLFFFSLNISSISKCFISSQTTLLLIVLYFAVSIFLLHWISPCRFIYFNILCTRFCFLLLCFIYFLQVVADVRTQGSVVSPSPLRSLHQKLIVYWNFINRCTYFSWRRNKPYFELKILNWKNEQKSHINVRRKRLENCWP